MKKFTSGFAVVAFTAMLVSSAFASGATTSPGSSSPSSTSASPTTTSAGADFTARHTMEGEVTSVNSKKGQLKLKTTEGTMELHFPPSALASVKKGDRISVELAMKPAGTASLKSDKDTKGSASPKTEKK